MHYQADVRALAMIALLVPLGARAGEVRGQVTAGGRPAWRAAVLIEAPGAEAPPQKVRLDEAWLSFVPKVQVVPVGSQVVFGNHDDASHTVHAWRGRRTLFELATAPGGREQAVALERPGAVVVTCDMHEEMRGLLVVTRARYFALTDEEGRFRIDGVPDGKWAVRVVLADAEGGDDDEPGVRAGEAAVPGPELALAVAASPVAAARGPSRPPPGRDRTPASFENIAGWPRGAWVYPASALALVLGLLAAVGNLKAQARVGASKLAAVAAGCGLAALGGATVIVGLHAAVATALGFGLFVGTAVFGAAEDPEERA